MTVRVGDFCCVPISGEVGKLISFGEWLNGDGFGDYDHAEIYVGNPPHLSIAEFGYTFGAYPGGAKYTPLYCYPEKLAGSLWSSSTINPTPLQRNNILLFCAQLEGTPYSVIDYLALVLHRCHIPAPLLKNRIASSKHLICSQLVDYVYTQAGIHLFNDNRWPGYVTPKSLADLIGGTKSYCA